MRCPWTSALNPSELRLQERLARKLSESLDKAGYKTNVITIPKDSAEDQVVKSAMGNTNIDGILSVNVLGRYLAAGPSTDYFPSVLVKVKQTDPKSGSTIYEDSFSYGYAAPQMMTVHFASDATYRFANIDLLVADPAKTREGLLAGIDAIVAQITADLKRN